MKEHIPVPADSSLEAERHDAWFRAQVQEALDDKRPGISHQSVMAEVQALIDRKRCDRS